MSERFTMAPGCTGVTMEDGTRYTCKPGGSIEVERPDHVAAIRRSRNYTLGHMGRGGVRVGFAGSPLPDNLCPACGHNMWPWSRVCGRCGAPMGGGVYRD